MSALRCLRTACGLLAVMLLVAAWSPSRAGASGAIELVLRDEAVVASGEVRLSDVTRVANGGGGGIPPALAALPVATIDDGDALAIDAAWLRSRIIRAGHGADAAILGGGPCVVARRGERVDGALLRNRVERAALDWCEGLGDSIELEVGEPPAAWIPQGTSSFTIVVPEGPASPGAATFFVDVEGDGRPVAHLPVRVTITVHRYAPVATRRLTRHERIRAADVRWQRIAVRSRGVSLPGDMTAITSCRTRRVVPEGTVLANDMFEAQPAVRRGEDVTVGISSGQLRVTLVARALEDGAPNDVIRVRNPFTRETLRARVTGPGQLEFVAGAR